uniref:Uncharacterized protein n=1 Tax=Zea mays TaxID=4577 RepID=C4J3T5_MAIZE|nr:unknown [Zea mays]
MHACLGIGCTRHRANLRPLLRNPTGVHQTSGRTIPAERLPPLSTGPSSSPPPAPAAYHCCRCPYYYCHYYGHHRPAASCSSCSLLPVSPSTTDDEDNDRPSVSLRPLPLIFRQRGQDRELMVGVLRSPAASSLRTVPAVDRPDRAAWLAGLNS